MNSNQLVWQKYALEWQGYARHDFPLISKLSFACNRDRVNSNAKCLGVQVLQAGTSQDQIKLFILSLSLIYLYFEKAIIKATTVTPKWQSYCFRLE